MPWIYDPHPGEPKILKYVQEETKRRILAHADQYKRRLFPYMDEQVNVHIL